MRIALAPMEGVINHTLRDLLTRLGGIDRCVTEFVRVTDQLLPARTFHRLCPELLTGGTTPAGVPVYVQLLGGKPAFMAHNAGRAAALGAPGIDLNFGCPAKTVNRNDGGSVLLREPQRVFDIVHAVRDAVPAEVPVTAKIRLGYEDSSLFGDIAGAVQQAGASELTIHARTKADGYKPPAHWHLLAAVRRQLTIPIFANGEIWSWEESLQCREQSGCVDIMLGRGVLARPDLPRHVRGLQDGRPMDDLSWPQVIALLRRQLQVAMLECPIKHAVGPTKQWLGYLRRHYVEAAELFEQVKRITDPVVMERELLARQGRD